MILQNLFDSQGVANGAEASVLLPSRQMKRIETSRERLNKLTCDERCEALHDLHGVAFSDEGDEEWLAEKIKSMGEEMDNLPDYNREAYLEALRQNPSLVDSVGLRCLRAESFSPQKAAVRLARHFDAKRDLFGRGKLGKELGLDDLTKEERQHFKEGYIQLLDQRDCRGRAIIWVHGEKQVHFPVEGQVKMLFLCTLIATQDEEIARNGIVVIYYGVGQRQIVNLNRTRSFVTSLETWPARVVAIHSCHDSPALHEGVKVASKVMSLRDLGRYQCHFGSFLECVFILSTFGIPRHVLPLDQEGKLECQNHLRWLQTLEESGDQEGTQPVIPPNTSVITDVLPNDILFGRGQKGVRSAGNRKLKKLLLEYSTAYEEMPRHAKSVIVKVLHREMKALGCRFLLPLSKDENALWVEADERMIRSRIAHGFRNLRLMCGKKV